MKMNCWISLFPKWILDQTNHPSLHTGSPCEYLEKKKKTIDKILKCFHRVVIDLKVWDEPFKTFLPPFFLSFCPLTSFQTEQCICSSNSLAAQATQ